MSLYRGHKPIEGDNVVAVGQCVLRGREPTGSDAPVVSLPPKADDSFQDLPVSDIPTTLALLWLNSAPRYLSQVCHDMVSYVDRLFRVCRGTTSMNDSA